MPTEPRPQFLGRLSPNARGWIIVVGVIVYVVIGGLLLLFMPDQLLSHWFPDLEDRERAAFLGSAAQVVLFGLGGVIAVVGVGLSLARHAEELLAAEVDRKRAALQSQVHGFEREKEDRRRAEIREQRDIEIERELRGRFVSAVELMASSDTMKRTAGLYSSAALADDWQAFRRNEDAQACIDVICYLLRSPLPRNDGIPDASEVAVRRSGYAILRSRLNVPVSNGSCRWSGFLINLRDAPLVFNVDLSDAALDANTIVDFSGAILEGQATLNMDRASVKDGGALRLDGAIILGASSISLIDSELRDGGSLTASDLKISESAGITASGLKISNAARATLGGNMSDDSKLVLYGARLTDSAVLKVSSAMANRSTLMANRIVASDNSIVDLSGTTANGEARLRLSDSGVEAEGAIWTEHVTLSHGDLEYVEGMQENDLGRDVRTRLVRSEHRVAFGPGTTVGAAGLADEGDPLLD